MKRVVITGMGAITPLGNSVEDTWAGIRAGKSGISNITHFDTTNFRVKIGGEVKDFDPTEFIDKKDGKMLQKAKRQ